MVVRLSKDTYGCARDDSCRSHKAGEFAMMSRRKQARPQHIDNVKELALLLENGTHSSSDTDEGDEHVCGKCRAEFKELVTFLQHKQRCTSKRPVLLPSDECSPLSVAEVTDETDTKLLPICSNGDLLTLVPRKSTYGESESDIPDDRDEMLQPSHLPQNHLIQQQIVSEIIKDGAPHLVALQSALCTLQQQQIVQLQVIQELQNQLLGASDSPLSVSSVPPLIGTVALTPPQSSDANPGAQAPSSSVPSAPTPSRTITNTANLPIASTSEKIGQSSADTSSLRISEPNTLELLERHTEQALQNTMAGSSFLLNGINGSSSEIAKFRKNKTGTSKSDDPSIRHKCRFCGKVFGSDSSLQIHIRSHTGERPFKCNVCGNRFTTRGNLKVHFQRHKSKYPHIIMNTIPIPEYLDNLHPPLESPSDTPNHLLPSPHGNSPAFSLDQDRVRDVLLQEGERIEAISPPNISNSSDATEISAEDSMPPEDGEKGEMKIDPEDPENQKQGLSPLTDHHSDISEKDFDTDNEQHQTSSFVISTSSPTFSSFFQTTSYAPGVTVPLCFAPVSSSTTKLTTTDSTLDPAFYQNLLPRPGTNDNSWESLMEVTNPSETAKLQQLVDNIEHKLIDPNQCIICHRVLSCKSALQMHYRTHTGERPFKCKICSRAFTTKGNLKTHMGVHRVKPPVRVLHQCPICHKQFSNSLILQQHIRMHTGETTDSSIQSKLLGADIKSLSVLPPSFPRLPMPDIPQHLISPASKSISHSPSISAPTTETVIRTMASLSSSTSRTESATQILSTPERDKPITVMAPSTSSPSPLLTPSSYTASLVALENQVKSITTNIPHPLPFSPFGMGMSANYLRHDAPAFHGRQTSGPDKSPSSAYSPASAPSRPGSETSADGRSTPGSAVKSESPPSVIAAVRQEGESALDLTPKTTCSASSSLSDTMSKALPPPLIGLPFAATPGRFNTTCKICFKTFACNSALEIHYRSHTKERPFKCNLCDRGFSTRGNMKQHMLTHRIRDLPSQLFTATTSSNSLDGPTSTSPIESVTKPVEVTPPQKSPEQISTQPQKRPIIDDIPQTKRSPSVPKHLCKTCNKPFSSGSALQIHMRTHTGDKPFKCTVCGRPFTTKGNLKVHMGTHMWSSPTSRRGRRMSLELPLSPVRAGEFPTPRPELFFPYLPPGYLNGINTPKMNEISVIQTAGLSNGTMTGPAVNPSGRPNQQDGSKAEEELENRKSPAHGNQTSPTFPTLSPASPITTERPAAWGWKIACNICNKICCSSLELESHIKTHHYTESSHGPTSSNKELVGQSQ